MEKTLAMVPFVIAVVMRVPKIGVGSALLVTFLQAIGAIWMIIKAVWKFVQTAADKTIARKNADDMLGQTDAALADAQTEYEHELTKLDHEHKG